jgi:two-component system alkaline phosphatase synthesis response regulator PhoP
VLLDIMLPGEDGFSILKRLRQSSQAKALPVIMLTAKSQEFDQVKGLDMGADDYVTKPFGVLELISRVNAVLRRAGGAEEPVRLEYGGIVIDGSRREVFAAGGAVELTFKEYELLHYLLLNAGLVLTRDKIMRAVWDYSYEGESRTLDMHIRSLRKKLGKSAALIKTVRNVGYKLGD